MIKDLLPKTSYERESLLKGFLLFFLTVEVLLGAVSLLIFRIETINLKNRIYLELKNFSYTFEGERFKIEVVPLKEGDKFYELFEEEKGLSILVPVPGTKKDALKIYYPSESYKRDLRGVALKTLGIFLASSFVSALLSLIFSLYSINPLRKALIMIEEVTRDIVHDLNTPLMSLMVNLKLIGKKYSGEEVKRSMAALNQIVSLQENLRPLLTKVELKLEEIDLKDTLLDVLENFKSLYPEIEVSVEAEKVKVKADRNAWRRIVENLISNAFKHNVRNGWVRVKLKGKTFLVENSSKPLKNPSKVFERYYRESQRGLGLGLSIVKKLSEEMGWKVEHSYKEGVFSIKVTLR